ncbi:hypothetical protein D3C80_1377790 [compost metagenome]
MHIGAYNVAAPDDNQIGIHRILRAGSTVYAHRILPAGCPGCVTDFGVQAACAEPVKEAAVHPAHAEHTHIAVEVVRQNTLWPVPG